MIGDLGDLGGTLKNYKENYKGMMDGDWDVIKLIMDLKKKYYGSPYGYNFFTYGGDVNDPLFNYSSLKRNNQEYLALFGQSHLWADQSKIYLSKSILRMVYNKEVNQHKII